MFRDHRVFSQIPVPVAVKPGVAASPSKPSSEPGESPGYARRCTSRAPHLDPAAATRELSGPIQRSPHFGTVVHVPHASSLTSLAPLNVCNKPSTLRTRTRACIDGDATRATQVAPLAASSPASVALRLSETTWRHPLRAGAAKTCRIERGSRRRPEESPRRRDTSRGAAAQRAGSCRNRRRPLRAHDPGAMARVSEPASLSSKRASTASRRRPRSQASAAPTAAARRSPTLRSDRRARRCRARS